MLYRQQERLFDGAKVIIKYWRGHADEQPMAESKFYDGYLEIIVMGTGKDKIIGHNAWKIIYIWPKEVPLRFSEQYGDLILIPMDETCRFSDIAVGTATMQRGAGAPLHPVIIVDFELPDGDIIKKIVLSRPDGTLVEVPDDTLH